MIDAIFVIGKPGSGKSIMVWYLTGLLLENGQKVLHLSDRLGLEDGVLRDIKTSKPDGSGIRTGKHSKLIADGPPGHRKVHVLDGTILNKVHQSHVWHVKNHSAKDTVHLVEYAIGPEISFSNDREPLHQSADHLVNMITKQRILNRVFILDVESPLPIRAFREMARPDAMAPETFRSYFPDGGEMTSEAKKLLGPRYHRFRNLEEDHDGYYAEARHVFESQILPALVKVKNG